MFQWRRTKWKRLMFLEIQSTLSMSIEAMLLQKIRGPLLLFAVSNCTKTDPFAIVRENYYLTSFNRRISPIQEFNQILVGSRILVLWVRKSSSFLEKKWKHISLVIIMLFWRERMIRYKFSRIATRDTCFIGLHVKKFILGFYIALIDDTDVGYFIVNIFLIVWCVWIFWEWFHIIYVEKTYHLCTLLIFRFKYSLIPDFSIV
jgi:hypothetical protein